VECKAGLPANPRNRSLTLENLAAKPLEYWEVTYAVGILNRVWNHLWLDSEDSRELGLELIVLAEAMHSVRGGM